MKNAGSNQLWRYSAEAEQMCSQELGRYGTYGLMAEEKNRSEWKLAGLVHDVTLDFGAARKMAELFTEYQLSCVHFMDLVEDMLP